MATIGHVEGNGSAVTDGRTGEVDNRVTGESTNQNAPQNAGLTRDQSNLIGLGAIAGPGQTPILLPGVRSEFNPLYQFSYAKFMKSTSAGGTYDAKQHRDIRAIDPPGTIIVREPKKIFDEHKTTIENPSASRIIEWSREGDGKVENPQILGPTPYQLNDFLWCKWYGKIPNNRLLTLRRYPIPIEDNLRIFKDKEPLVPLAQAVTWWGEETGNKLSEILNPTFGLNWKPLSTAEVQTVNGNAIQAEKLLDTLGVKNEILRKAILSVIFSNPENPQAFTGYDKALQDWTKESYGAEGAYWNRILGPVNVIDSNILIRNSGFTFENDITLKFEYKLRAYDKLNPKIAMLDLISNFLALTYNRADFWGGSSRYYERTGAILAGISTESFAAGNFPQGVMDFLKQLIAPEGPLAQGGSQVRDLVFGIIKAGTGLTTGDETQTSSALDELGKNPIVSATLGAQLKELIQVPLKMRSILDGRAIGEWHLTLGNPMNPIAVIGNLCLKSTKMTFTDSLGLDDFPTGVSFTVTLQHGRPRAKQDIESMFNLGGGDMYQTKLAPPASAYNSYGEYNSARLASAQTGSPLEQTISTGNQVTTSDAAAQNIADIYRPAIRAAYGEKFGASPILPDYFRQIVTKD